MPMLQLEYHDRSILSRVDDFQNALERLTFEGKVSVGKNLSQIEHAVVFFKRDLERHMALEDKRLFPYLATHIPKLEPVLNVLQAEHEDFREGLHELDEWVRKLRRAGKVTADRIERIKNRGCYLALLLRSHLWEESQALDKTVNRVLRADEKRELARLLGKGCRITEVRLR